MNVEGEYRFSEITGIDLQYLEANGFEVEIDGDRKIVIVKKR